MKKLYRSASDKMIGGVCGGLAQYFGIDSNLVRFIFIISIFFNGIGLITYIAALIIIPPEKTTESVEKEEEFDFWKQYRTVRFWGYVFIIAGLTIILSVNGWLRFWIFDYINWGITLGILLIIIGLYFLFKKNQTAELEEEINQIKSRFYRVHQGRMIAGVCKGLEEILEIDVSFIRIAWILLSIFSTGLFVLLYVLLAILLPEKTEEESQTMEQEAN